MRTNLWRLASLMVLLAMLISPVGAAGVAYAAPQNTQSAAETGPVQVISAKYVGVSQSLTSLAANLPSQTQIQDAKELRERFVLPKTEQKGNGSADVSFVQNSPVGDSMPAFEANFDGVGNVNGVLPPDTNGDIGYDPSTSTKYYMQWVNLSFQIWDVTNPAAVTSLYGPAAGNTLWTGTGTICEANNDGDPIVLFDHLANRWMVSQFALGFPNNFHQCIAVSTSADPTDTWYLYDFQTSTTLMNDYPHFGVWADGYYMTVNQFNGVSSAWEGAGVAVFERDAMIQGLPANMIYIDIGAVTLDYGGMLPSDLDGPAPAVGTPNYFMEWDDSTWLGDPADTLRIWEFHTDWVTPANTTFGLNANFDPNLTIATANVDPDMCGGARACIPQPGTTSKLDAIADRLMYRLQYRDFGGYQTLVGNHTVDATSSDHAGVHWFELRDAGTGWGMNQQGIYAPDADNRWMGSIAMDGAGNMALGYSVASATTSPSIRYTGRLAGDPLDTLPQGESVLIAGTGSQTSTSSRWGDYSMMGVDPSDDCTFWYTQEYYATTSSAGWLTRVGSFRFPSCTSLPTGTLTGTVTNVAGGAAIAGATVSLTGGYSTITNASGVYTIVVPAGTYDVTVSKYGFLPGSVTGVSVVDSTITTQDFALTAAPSYTVSGVVTDAATGWPLYARLDLSGYPLGPVFTDPVTGAYSVNLIASSYNFTASAMSGGYVDGVAPVVVASNLTQDFALNASAACTAPGYSAGSAILTEGFEGTFPPTGWNKYETDAAGAGFIQGTTATTGSHGDPHSGTYYAWHNDDMYDAISWLVTPQVAVPAGGGAAFFWQRGYWGSYYSYHSVLVTTGASPDPTVSTYVELWNGNTGETWAQQSVDLSAYAGQNIYLAFEYEGNFADEWYLDDVSVQEPCAPLVGYGLVTGSVEDANTSLLVLDATVQDGSSNMATLIDASADPATPDQVYVIGQPAGPQSLTATAAGYGPDTRTPTVVAGGTVAQDFFLPSGLLSVAPSSLAFNVLNTSPTDSDSLTLSNTGGVSAAFEVFAVEGVAPASSPVPTGPFAPNTRHVGPKNLNDKDASKLRVDLAPRGISPLAAGDLTTSWATGLTYAWGIGFNTDATDLWLGNLGAAGGDDLDYRFTTAGVNTGDTIDTAPWIGTWAGDMTYNPFTKTIWQVNVGGDNCIYELDPVSMAATGGKICPAFGTSERGLAFDPVTNTYYAGSWTDGILNHFAPDGTILDSLALNLSISGLAYNPGTQHLFVMTNAETTTDPSLYDVYVLDTQAAYAIVGGFNLKNGAVNAFDDYAQAGLELDCSGNLWAVDQTAQEVYVADSGETGVCDWQPSWLTVTPTTGSVADGGNQVLTVNVDATGLAIGTYQAHVRVTSDTPSGDLLVPVTLTVGGATFADVPATYWAFNWIERLYAAGITGGCGSSPLIYCPENRVTRAEMAVFLLRGMHGSSYTPPAATGTVFTDVPATYWAAAWIEQLYAEGITGGCGTGLYCPNNQVTRAEMAIFLLRGEHGSSYAPPAATGTVFTDVPGTYWAAAWIEQLYAEGITGGCGSGLYCPDNRVTRAEMAVFLVRAFSLP